MTFRGGIWRILTTQPDPNSPEGFVSTDPLHERSASIRYVTPGFFNVMRTPLLRGRDVRDTDTLDTPLVAVVSASLAQQQYPGQDPIGKQFAIAYGVRTIVGVVGDIRVRGLERESEPQVYMPASQQQDRFLGFYSPSDLVVRTTVAPESLISAARDIIWKAERQMPITSVQTLEDVVAGETAPRLVQLRVLGGFAAVALLLAAIGIHGLLAFTVSARVREIGVRIALGASARDIMWIVMGRSTMLAVIGVAIGGALAYAAGRSLQALLFGVSPSDVTVFGGAIAVALLMTLAGSVLPAWRAIKIDPIAATRTD
jgi:predicted permease